MYVVLLLTGVFWGCFDTGSSSLMPKFVPVVHLITFSFESPPFTTIALFVLVLIMAHILTAVTGR
jgi:hypothetical protein